MSIVFAAHKPDIWAVPESEVDMMRAVRRKRDARHCQSNIDILLKNEFLRMETRGKRVYKDAMQKIGVEV